MKAKTKMVIAVLVVLGGALLIREVRLNKMERYAEQHNCEWHYSYYINEEPVCR